MPGHHVGPGKCAPRLFTDLQAYEPQRKGLNSLSEPPPRFDQNASTAPPSKHVHTFLQLPRSSPVPDRLDTSEKYNTTAICQSCRLHVKVEVDFSQRPGSLACPTSQNPYHHLCYDPSRSAPVDATYIEGHRQERWEDKRAFICSSTTCPVVITITTRPPILTPDLTAALVDKSQLRTRAKEAIETASHLYGGATEIEPLAPYSVLESLVTYLDNLKSADQRHIPLANKRYVLSFGKHCHGVMERAHFTLSEEDGGLFWKPPPEEELRDPHSQVRQDIQTMLNEVMLLMHQNKGPGQVDTLRNFTRANDDIRRLLSCAGYDASKHSSNNSAPEHPHYAGLGAISEFSDKQIFWAYERQKVCDAQNAPYYLECLAGIARGRVSEFLSIEVASIKSRGEYTPSDVMEAYKALGIDHKTPEENFIIGVFRSRLADAPRQETQMREALRIIGKARNSPKILNVAQKAIGNPNQAYSWLGVPDMTDDEFIISTYQVRNRDNPGEEATAREAVRIIAEARQSPTLLSFIERGSAYNTPMDLNTAYTHLGCEDQTVSDDILISVYGLRLQDAPGQLQDLRAAMRVIGESRNSNKIREFLQTGNTEDHARGSANWPVGLENIGNTCYLNSLLQFYFTVKPLREMILNFDDYQETDVTDDVLERKRVGGRKVTKKEIEKAKDFVSQMRSLFQNLITSDASSVTPEHQLAYLALVSSKDEEDAVRRKSVASDGPPPLIKISDGEEDQMDIDSLGLQEIDDAASEATLVDELQDIIKEPQVLPPPYEDFVMVDRDAPVEDKENFVPNKDSPAGSIGSQREPLQDIAMNEVQNMSQKLNDSLNNNSSLNNDTSISTPLTPPPDMPDRPPPVPPRPKRKDTGDHHMFGLQQDVTECIGNVMFRVEAAIRPLSIDENGEQVDIVKKLFYGKTKQTLSFPNSSESRTKEELFSHLLVNVAEGDRDIYQALDSSFDIERVDLEGREAKRYLSITHLPPILQIQVQRVQFNREKGSAYKSNAHLSFQETIYLDRYMDTDDQALKARREESWKWKEEIRVLESRREELKMTKAGVSLPDTLEITREFLSEITEYESDFDIDPRILAALDSKAYSARCELNKIEGEIKERQSKVAQQFTDLRKYGYRIHSVFIHRGSVSFGHYWIYIYDFQRNIFRKYNDGYVTEVEDQNEVFNHGDQQPPTPYFLVFVREDQSLDITEAVKRQLSDTTSFSP